MGAVGPRIGRQVLDSILDRAGAVQQAERLRYYFERGQSRVDFLLWCAVGCWSEMFVHCLVWEAAGSMPSRPQASTITAEHPKRKVRLEFA